jgi:hypothetical protein
MDGYIAWHLRQHKQAVFTGLPDTVVEIGSGVGANFRYIRPGTRVIAVEPNPYMHRSLRLAAERSGSGWRFVTSLASGSTFQTRVPTPRFRAWFCASSRIHHDEGHIDQKHPTLAVVKR